jgi:hypothetical protein
VDIGSIGRLASKQHGVVSYDQLVARGMTPRQIERRVDNGSFERVHLGVMRLLGAPESYAQRLVAGYLAIGPEAAASHRAAACVHELLRYGDPPVEVTTIRRRSPEVSGVVVHRLMDLHQRWVVEIDGVRVTTVARTLVDLGAVASRRTVEAALDRAAGRKLVTYREVRDAMLAVARQGRRGVGTIRSLLDARIDEVIPAGVFSARMATVLRGTGLPRAVPEYTVLDEHGGFVAVVDFAYPEKRLAIEVDGYEFHSSPRAIRVRNQRDRMLSSIGWLALHFDWGEVERRPHEVASAIRREFWER